MQEMLDFMEIKMALISGKRKLIWQELLLKRLNKKKSNI